MGKGRQEKNEKEWDGRRDGVVWKGRALVVDALVVDALESVVRKSR